MNKDLIATDSLVITDSVVSNNSSYPNVPSNILSDATTRSNRPELYRLCKKKDGTLVMQGGL